MKRFNWWTTIVLLLISQAHAASVDAKTQESDLKADSSKELLKAAASSAEYSASLANDYANEKQQDNVAASSSSVSAVDSGSYNNQAEGQSQYSQPLSYSQPGTPVQPIHSYSQPLNYAPQALPYTSESQVNHQYNPVEQGPLNGNVQTQQYPSIKDLPNPEIPSASASSSYYPQYPAPQQYNPHLVLQQQASAPVSEYHNAAPVESAPQYESNQATYLQQPQQHQQVYLHQQHHVAIPGSAYSEQSYVVDNNNNKEGYAPQANSYSQPLPPEYSPQEYSHGNGHNNVQVKPKKTVILAIPVKLVAKNKYGQNNGGYAPQPDIQPHYSSNVVPAAANLPVAHSIEKNNYYGNDEKQPSFQEKPLYADKPAYTEKAVDDYQKVNHNLNNNLNNNGGYNGEYEPENDHYRGPRGPYQHKPSGPGYNLGREVKPLSNYQTRPRKPTGYGPGPEYTTSNGPAIEEEVAIAPEHSSYPTEIEHNHLHAFPTLHKHKINDVYEPIADHMPPPYIPSDFPSLGGPLTGISSYANPMELIYSSPYKLSGPPAGYGKPSGYRPSLLGSASSQSPTSTSSSSNYGQFLSSLLSAYSLGSLKPSSSKPSGSKGLASYLNNLPGLDLLKGYSSLSPSYSSSLLTSASGMNKYYLPSPKQPGAAASKPGYAMGWPSEMMPQPSKPKPSGLLASSSNIVSSIDELFKSSLNPTSKFKRPLYSDATRAITNLYKKLLN